MVTAIPPCPEPLIIDEDVEIQSLIQLPSSSKHISELFKYTVKVSLGILIY